MDRQRCHHQEPAQGPSCADGPSRPAGAQPTALRAAAARRALSRCCPTLCARRKSRPRRDRGPDRNGQRMGRTARELAHHLRRARNKASGKRADRHLLPIQNGWPIRPAAPWREFATCASCPAGRSRASKQLWLDKQPAMAQMSTARTARYGQGAGTGPSAPFRHRAASRLTSPEGQSRTSAGVSGTMRQQHQSQDRRRLPRRAAKPNAATHDV